MHVLYINYTFLEFIPQDTCMSHLSVVLFQCSVYVTSLIFNEFVLFSKVDSVKELLCIRQGDEYTRYMHMMYI